jgi:hypothetical protein
LLIVAKTIFNAGCGFLRLPGPLFQEFEIIVKKIYKLFKKNFVVLNDFSNFATN